MSESSLRLQAVTERIAAAARAAGRDPASVFLLCVSKTHPAEAVLAMHAAGPTAFGENYAQELAAKAQATRETSGLRWVFIGSVQSNKLRLIVTHAAEIQSVGTFEHAQKIARLAHELGKTPYPVWLAVNAGLEASKTGVALADVPALAARIDALPELELRGLMAIPPPLANLRPPGSSEVPALYRELRAAADRCGQKGLSLGMSEDLEVAVAAGATVVRLGTALFGVRPSC